MHHSPSMSNRFRYWFQHECHANQLVLQSIQSVPETVHDKAEYQRALSIFSHIVAARRIWLERFGVLPATSKAMFPEKVNIDEITHLWSEVAAVWTQYLEQLTDEKLAETFQYQSMDAGRFSNTIEQVLTQLNGHAWYHRGQIAMLVKSAGGQPAITDLIYWCRQAVDE